MPKPKDQITTVKRELLAKAKLFVSVDAIRELDPAKSYLICMPNIKNDPTGEKEQIKRNKVELAFKALGIKNASVVFGVHAIYKTN